MSTMGMVHVVVGLFRFQWGADDVILGGLIGLGHVTPPAWRTVHFLGLHRERAQNGPDGFDGLRRRLLRQRAHGVVLGLDAD